MPQSLAQLYLHIVFSTKNRFPFLKEKHVRDRLHAYLAGICKNLDSPALIVGGFEDHVHLLCRFSKNMAVSHFLQELKRHLLEMGEDRGHPCGFSLAKWLWCVFG
jgi:putative transposase